MQIQWAERENKTATTRRRRRRRTGDDRVKCQNSWWPSDVMLRSHSHSHTPKASWVHQLQTCRRLHFLSVFLFFSKLELKSIKLIIKSFAMRLRFAFAHTFTAFCFCLICFCSHLLYVRACVDMYAWVCPPVCVCVCVFYSVHVCVYLSLCWTFFTLCFWYTLLYSFAVCFVVFVVFSAAMVFYFSLLFYFKFIKLAFFV